MCNRRGCLSNLILLVEDIYRNTKYHLDLCRNFTQKDDMTSGATHDDIFYMQSSEEILELLRSAINIALFHLGRQILQGNCI